MSDAMIVVCTSCGARLSLTDESRLGKKIRCPKCTEVFVAERSQPSSKKRDNSSDQELKQVPSPRLSRAQAPEDDAFVAKPQGSKRGPQKNPAKNSSDRSKKSSRRSTSRLSLVLGGVVAAVVLVIGGLFLSGFFASKPPAVAVTPVPPNAVAAPSTIDLSWLPPETEMVVHVRVSELWQAPLLKELLQSPIVTSYLLGMQESLQMTPADIESVTLGIPEAQTLVIASAMAFGAPVNPLAGKTYACVVRYKKPVSEQIFSDPRFSIVDQSGQKIYQFKSSNSEDPVVSLYAATPQVHVVADLESVKAAVGRGPGEAVRPAFAVMSPQDHLSIGFVPKDSGVFQLTNTRPPPPWAGELMRSMAESGQAIGIGFQVTTGLDLHLAFGSKSQDGSLKVKAGLDQAIKGLQGEYVANKDLLAFLVPPVGIELIEILANGLQDRVDPTYPVATLTASIPASAQSKLDEVPAILFDTFIQSLAAKESPKSVSPGIETMVAEPNSVVVSPPPVKEAMPAPESTNLPEGMKVNGFIEAKSMTPPESGTKLRVSVDLAEIGGAPVFSFQPLNFTELELNDDIPVAWKTVIKEETFFYFQTTAELQKFGQPLGSSVYTTVSEDVKFVKRARCTFKVLVGKDPQRATVKNVRGWLGKQVPNTELKAAGLKIAARKDLSNPSGGYLDFTLDAGYGIGDINLTQQNGELLSHQSDRRFEDGVFKFILAETEQFPIPKKFNAELLIYRDVEELEVALEFKDIPIPPIAKQ